jgi:hypothetical protein
VNQLAFIVLILTATATLVFAIGMVWMYPARVAVCAFIGALAINCMQLDKRGGGIEQIGVAVGGMNVYVDDLACVGMLVAGFVAVLRAGLLRLRSTWPLLALFAFAGVNIARGAMELGLKAAGNGGRGLMYLIAAPLAAVLLRPLVVVSPPRLARWLCGLGCVLTVVACGVWSGVLAGLPAEDDFRTVPRALPADYAMLIGQSLIAATSLHIAGMKRGTFLLVLGFMGMTIALQHRSVWAATFVGLTWLAMRTMKFTYRLWFQLAGAAAVGTAVLVLAGGVEQIDAFTSLVRTNVEETQLEDSTWNWRVNGFKEAVERLFSGDVSVVVFGPPSGWSTDTDFSVASVAIHSRYVDALAQYGIAGFLLLLMWLGKLTKTIGGWKRSSGNLDRETSIGTALLQSLLVSQLVYFIAYSGGLVEGGALALIWLAATSRRQVLGRNAHAWQRVGFPTTPRSRGIACPSNAAST